MFDPGRFLVQLVVTRRCNLSCGYCHEYDGHSAPVDPDLLERRIDHAGALGTLVLTLTGGEPLLHPRLEALVARTAAHGMVCTLILSKKGVKLGLVRGSELADPRGLLEGSGKVHKYVPLRGPADLRKPGLKPLIAAALAAWRNRQKARRP